LLAVWSFAFTFYEFTFFGFYVELIIPVIQRHHSGAISAT
jgi:hypothetical protein